MKNIRRLVDVCRINNSLLQDIELIDVLWRQDIDVEKGNALLVPTPAEQYERDLQLLTEKAFAAVSHSFCIYLRRINLHSHFANKVLRHLFVTAVVEPSPSSLVVHHIDALGVRLVRLRRVPVDVVDRRTVAPLM